MVKVISLSNDAYGRLKSLKGSKSFSEVVIELSEGRRKKGDLMKFFGVWADKTKEVEKMKRMIEKDRKKFKLREVKF